MLGSDPEELVRLDRQAAAIDGPTRQLLRAAGIAPGMRVLDLGTGLGHVARITGEFVGPAGSVVALDNVGAVLAAARQRTDEAGTRNVRSVEGDVTRWQAEAPFDAIVGRLLLFHVADPIAVVRHHLQNLKPGRLFVAIDCGIGASRTEPPVPRTGSSNPLGAGGVSRRRRMADNRRAARCDSRGCRAYPHHLLGVQACCPSRGAGGAAMLAGVVHARSPRQSFSAASRPPRNWTCRICNSASWTRHVPWTPSCCHRRWLAPGDTCRVRRSEQPSSRPSGDAPSGRSAFQAEPHAGRPRPALRWSVPYQIDIDHAGSVLFDRLIELGAIERELVGGDGLAALMPDNVTPTISHTRLA